MRVFKRPIASGEDAGRDSSDGAYRKAGRILFVVLGLYGVLVATHEGEFWPFSVYQMFSSAGRPWTRAMVRDLSAVPPASMRWTEEDVTDLSGRPFALGENGIAQNDITAYVARTAQWTTAQGERLRSIIGYERFADRTLAVYRVDGRLTQDGAVAVTCIPILYLAGDTLLINPHVDTDEAPGED